MFTEQCCNLFTEGFMYLGIQYAIRSQMCRGKFCDRFIKHEGVIIRNEQRFRWLMSEYIGMHLALFRAGNIRWIAENNIVNGKEAPIPAIQEIRLQYSDVGRVEPGILF